MIIAILEKKYFHYFQQKGTIENIPNYQDMMIGTLDNKYLLIRYFLTLQEKSRAPDLNFY